MKKIFSLVVLSLVVSFASFAITPIVGPHYGCLGSSAYVSDSLSPGGTWSSSDITVATIGSSTGIITPVATGVCTISYTTTSGTATISFTVNPAPAPIAGPDSVCVGATITATDATPGGVWSIGSSSIASVGSATGVITGVSTGITNVFYTIGSCYSYGLVYVRPATTVAAITGGSSVCVGSTTALSDATAGGTWSSTPTSVATVSSTGVVTGVSTGTAVITYSVTGFCGTATATYTVTVGGTVSAGTITGTTTTTVGSSTTLSDAVGGGTWTSSNTSIATVGASSGVVTGVATGACTITYTVSGCGGTAYTTASYTVTAVNRISGHISFSAGPIDSTDTVKVWLITYNPSTHMLEGVDSITTIMFASSIYYQFLGKATDSYRVKAAVIHTPFSSTGFIPTYHINHYYWHDADVIYHVSTVSDDGNDINMAYGTVTPGPGFIAGDVTTGANKGTSGSGPAVGLYVYLLNSSGSVIEQAITDAAGHYSFSSLPLGTYTVFPEALNYATTAFTGVTLTSAAPSVSAASFTQHTISKTITPHTSGLPGVKSSVATIAAFPNPTSGKLSIQWFETASETASVAVVDIAGRVVYSSSLSMTQGAGGAEVDLSSLVNGLYTISVKSANISYNNKLQIQH